MHPHDDRENALRQLAESVKALKRSADLGFTFQHLATPWAVILRDPVVTNYDRIRGLSDAREKLRVLLTRISDGAFEVMLIEVRELKPSWWRWSSEASQQRAAVETAEKYLTGIRDWVSLDMFRAFSDTNSNGREYRDQAGRPVLVFSPGKSLEQALAIHASGCWRPPNRCN